MAKQEPRKWYGGMRPVGRPKYETSDQVDSPREKSTKDTPKVTKEPKPLQKGLPPGEESVE